MNYSSIKQSALFKGISDADIEQLLSEFNIIESIFRKGDILARQDEPCNRLIMLLTGTVNGEMIDPSGKVVKVEMIEAPNPLAILFLFGPENRFPVQATACEDSTALVIPRQAILKMLSRNETLLKNYLDISASFAARLSRKLHFISFRTIRQKLAIYLLDLSKRNNSGTVKLDKTHIALAEYFGVSRQALERELKNMAADRLIAINGKLITLANKQSLVHLISF